MTIPRHRHPEIWRAAYGAAFANCAHDKAHLDWATRYAWRIADAAVKAYEAELDRIANEAP
jgi:hypothetical protein